MAGIVVIWEYGLWQTYFGLLGNMGTLDSGLRFRVEILGIGVRRNHSMVTVLPGNISQH